MLVCWLVRTAVVCKSVGSSSQTEQAFQRSFSCDMLCRISSPVVEATDGMLCLHRYMKVVND